MKKQINNIIIVFTLKIFIFLSGPVFSADEFNSGSSNYVVKGFTVIDLRNGISWMRCSLGQSYSNNQCNGDAVRLNHQQIKEAIKIANLELGGIWRLPSKRELELLVCANCDPPKIDKKSFPSTSKEPYWTGQKNWISPKNFWSINFMTGYSYGRFFPDKELAVRLVKDR